jgi:UDP-2,4-diacetamido-2,4,6-trideoxy-beta-L-altropyranose hydrolase
MTNWFVIRADANEEIGIGHVMRCLALAEWLSDYQYKPVLITKYFNSFIETKIIELNGKMIIISESADQSDEKYSHSNWLKGSERNDALQCTKLIEQEKSTNGNISPLFIIVDHYALAAPWEKKLSFYAPILVVDDLSDREHDCTWLVDQTFGKTKNNYDKLVSENTVLMIGPKYGLLRKEFSETAKKQQRELPLDKVRILVTLGGVDKNNDTSKILSYLDTYEHFYSRELEATRVTSSSNPLLKDLEASIIGKTNRTLKVNVSQMAEIMANNDVCIGAAGSTSWERCVMAIPTISMVIAENQQTIATNLEQAGIILNLGVMADITQEKFHKKMDELLNSDSLYRSLSEKSYALCDGLGSQRVAIEINKVITRHSQNLTLKNVTLADAKLIYKWQCAPNTRKYFNNTSIPNYDDHLRWIESAISKNDMNLFLICTDENKVGTIRVDINSENSAEVSILIAPNEYGRGYAKKALTLLIDSYAHFDLTAYVHKDNHASQHLFKKCGFKKLDPNNFIKNRSLG